MPTFGPGDYGGYNDWAFAQGAYWTNWNTSVFNPGSIGRITAIGARWDAYSGLSPGTASGHNTLWTAAGAKTNNTATYATTPRAAGTTAAMHNVALISNEWQPANNFFIGFECGSGDSHIHSWADGANGGYSGKSASDASVSGGTANWGGTVNGGLPVFGTNQIVNIFVRRGGVMTAIYTYAKRSGVFNGPLIDAVRRGGVQNPLDLVAWLNATGRHIPARGLRVLVDVGEGWEVGWAVEGPIGWFGSIDPTKMGVKDWTRPFHEVVPLQAYSGRFNSIESEEVVDRRMREYDQWQRALRAGTLHKRAA